MCEQVYELNLEITEDTKSPSAAHHVAQKQLN